MSKAQIERIKKMESYLDEAGTAIAELTEAGATFPVKILRQYIECLLHVANQNEVGKS